MRSVLLGRWPSASAPLLFLNYRGYGDSQGKPSERNLLADALELYDWISAQSGVLAQRVVVIGRSLGTGIAAYVACQRPAAAAILITPYDSIVEIARRRFPYCAAQLLLKHRFDALRFASLAKAPALVLLAEHDSVIPKHHAMRLLDAWAGPKQVATIAGVLLSPFQIAYQTYGALNKARSNAVLVCHALSGDQHVAEPHPITGAAGWWTTLVGQGGVLDTDRYFLICANVLGGCMGTTGPKDLNPATGEPWALNFPVITIRDMVRAQKLLIEHLGIERLFCVIGGSMGAMQVLQWASSYPEAVVAAVAIAGSARHSAQNIAFHEVGRQAIIADPDWCGGRYLSLGHNPARGLAVARMAAHITYLSEEALTRKFGRRLQNAPKDPSEAISLLFGMKAIGELIKLGNDFKAKGYDLKLNG
jgi:homoserine O-acetyltransferase